MSNNKYKLTSKMIATCGMNCSICLGYLREKNHCPGCKNLDQSKHDYCRKCTLRACKKLKQLNIKFCGPKCKTFPCYRLKQLDKRYRARYGMSMLENLEYIDKHGIRKFVKLEKGRRKCKKCKQLICIHRPNCVFCGQKR